MKTAQEALKVARAALIEIVDGMSEHGPRVIAEKALAATASIEQPEVASAPNMVLLIDELLASWLSTMHAPDTPEVQMRRINARSALESGIGAHCAQQVAAELAEHVESSSAAIAALMAQQVELLRERDDLRAQLAARDESVAVLRIELNDGTYLRRAELGRQWAVCLLDGTCIRYLDRHECEFVDSAIRTASAPQPSAQPVPDAGPDLTRTAIPAGDVRGSVVDQLYAAFHREPCGDTLAAIGGAIQEIQAIKGHQDAVMGAIPANVLAAIPKEITSAIINYGVACAMEDTAPGLAIENALRLIGAALHRPAASYPEIPEDWQIVPKVPTDDMVVAFCEAWFCKARCFDDPEMADAYGDMLAAAPTPPAGES
jgi:hypothetical protein